MQIFDAPALTMTVLLQESVMCVAISDGRAIGQIASLPVPCAWLPATDARAYGAQLYAQLFPEKVRLFLRPVSYTHLTLPTTPYV